MLAACSTAAAAAAAAKMTADDNESLFLHTVSLALQRADTHTVEYTRTHTHAHTYSNFVSPLHRRFFSRAFSFTQSISNALNIALQQQRACMATVTFASRHAHTHTQTHTFAQTLIHRTELYAHFDTAASASTGYSLAILCHSRSLSHVLPFSLDNPLSNTDSLSLYR